MGCESAQGEDVGVTTSVTSRERLLAAVAERLARVDQQGDTAPLFGPEADAELGALLRGCDIATDMEARYVAGWLYWYRCASLGQGHGAEEGSCAGTLLFPVWVRDRDAVPPELGGQWAALPPDSWPDPAAADGPAMWSLVCRAATAAGQGRQLPGQPPEMANAFDLPGSTPHILRAQAIGAGRLAVLATDDDDPALPLRVQALADAVAAAATAEDDDELRAESVRLADESLRLQRRAVRRTPAGAPDRLSGLSDHGLALARRYERTADPEDLDEAIGIARDLLAQTADGDADTPRYRSNLALALSLRLDRVSGAVADFDEAVELFRLAAPGDPNGPGSGLSNLGGALLRRYEVTGAPADLEEAITVLTRSRREAWTEPHERSRADELLALALRARHARLGDVHDLEEARRLLGGGSGPGGAGAVAPGGVVDSGRVSRSPGGSVDRSGAGAVAPGGAGAVAPGGAVGSGRVPPAPGGAVHPGGAMDPGGAGAVDPGGSVEPGRTTGRVLQRLVNSALELRGPGCPRCPVRGRRPSGWPGGCRTPRSSPTARRPARRSRPGCATTRTRTSPATPSATRCAPRPAGSYCTARPTRRRRSAISPGYGCRAHAWRICRRATRCGSARNSPTSPCTSRAPSRWRASRMWSARSGRWTTRSRPGSPAGSTSSCTPRTASTPTARRARCTARCARYAPTTPVRRACGPARSTRDPKARPRGP